MHGKIQLDRISIKILLSYLMILLLPFCAIVGIYFFATQAILSMEKEKSQYTLAQTSKLIDLRLKELEQITTYIVSDTLTVSIANRARQNNPHPPILQLYQLSHYLPNYSLSNQMIKDVFIFFNDTNYTVHTTAAFETTDYNYNAHINFCGISYETFNELKNTPFHQGTLLITQEGEDRGLFMLRTIPNIGPPKGLVVISIDESNIQELLQSNQLDKQTSVYIQTKDGELVTSLGDVLPVDTRSIFLHNQSSEVTVEKKEYVLSTAISNYDWIFVSTTAKEHVLYKISFLRYPILLLGGLSVFLGLLICIVLWYRRDRFYKKVVFFAESSGVTPKARSEQRFLDEAVTSFMDIMGNLNTTLQQQRDLLFNSVLRGILYGNLETLSQVQTKESGAIYELDAPYYSVAYVFTSDIEKMSNADSLAYRLHLKQVMQNTFSIPFKVCDLDTTGLVVLFLAPSQEALSRLPQEMDKLIQVLKRSDGCAPLFTLSDSCTSLDTIWELFKQSKDTLEYMRLRDEQGYRLFESITTCKDFFSFPSDIEVGLVQLLKKGNQQELESFLENLYMENIVNHSLSLPMMKEFFSVLRQSFIQTLSETPVKPEDVKALVEDINTAVSIRSLSRCALRMQEKIKLAYIRQNNAEDADFKEMLRAYIQQNYNDPGFSLYALSVEANISEAALYRKFKCLFGVTFSEYLEQYRIKQACELLQQHVPVKDVAKRTGYASDHAFRRAFKRITNVVPSRYHPA